MSTNNNSNNPTTVTAPATPGTVTIPNPSFTSNITTTTVGGWSIFYPIPSTVPDVEEKKKSSKDGCNCKKCKEFYPYAEPNQEDGSLICYACRHGY